MTTIAFKNGCMAADSQETDDNFKWPMRSQKLYVVKSRWLVGGSGNSAVIVAFLEWLELGRHPDKRPVISDKQEFAAIVWDGQKLEYFDEGLFPIPVTCECFAIGSGRDFAMGAMMAGATAVQAVEVASLLDVNTGGPVQAEYL